MWIDQRGSTELRELQLTRGFSRKLLGKGFECAFDIRFVCFWSHGLNDARIKTSAAMPCCRIYRGGTALLAALVGCLLQVPLAAADCTGNNGCQGVDVCSSSIFQGKEVIANCGGGGDFTCLDTDAKSYWKCLHSQELSVAALCQLGQYNFGGRYRFTFGCGVLREPKNCNTYKFTCFDKQQLLQPSSGSPRCVGDDCGRADPCGSSKSANQPYSMD